VQSRRCRHMVKLLSFGCWGLSWTFAPGVSAIEASVPFEVHVLGDAVCPSATFLDRLARLSPRLRPAQSGEMALDFGLHTVKTAGVFSGELRVRELDGYETTRAITGGSCDEVLSALALIAAVLIDSNAEPRPPEARVSGMEAPVADRSSDAVSAGWWRLGAGVGAGIETAVSPEVVPTFSLQLEAEHLGRGTFSPRIALAVHRSAGSTVETAAGSAHFRWTAARVSGCPVRFPVVARLAVQPCLFFDVGALEATGQQTYQSASANLVWYALGGVARAEYVPMAPLSISLDGGLLLPLVHDRFYFDPGGPPNTLQLPRIGFTLRAGIAVYFE